MKLTVYGPGCEKCKQLYAAAQEAARQAGLDEPVEKVEKAAEIARAGVLFTPGLAVDGQVKSTGKVVDAAQIVQWIEAAKH